MTNLGNPEFQKRVNDSEGTSLKVFSKEIEARIAEELEIKVPILESLAIEVANAAKNKGIVKSDLFYTGSAYKKGIRKYIGSPYVDEYTPTDRFWVIREPHPKSYRNYDDVIYGVCLEDHGDLSSLDLESAEGQIRTIGNKSLDFLDTRPVPMQGIENALFDIEFIEVCFDSLAQFVRKHDLQSYMVWELHHSIAVYILTYGDKVEYDVLNGLTGVLYECPSNSHQFVKN